MVYFTKYLVSVDFYLITLLSLIAVVGDYVVVHSKLHIYRAIFDNATHAFISGLSWFLVILHHKRRPVQSLQEIIVATLIASLIDIDHFIAAKSVHLRDAVKLENRPILHCSTIPIVISTLICAIAKLIGEKSLHRYALLLFLSVASHHTRDATRRGYWFGPFGSTPPIPYVMYIILTCALPYVVIFLLKILYNRNFSEMIDV